MLPCSRLPMPPVLAVLLLIYLSSSSSSFSYKAEFSVPWQLLSPPAIPAVFLLYNPTLLYTLPLDTSTPATPWLATLCCCCCCCCCCCPCAASCCSEDSEVSSVGLPDMPSMCASPRKPCVSGKQALSSCRFGAWVMDSLYLPPQCLSSSKTHVKVTACNTSCQEECQLPGLTMEQLVSVLWQCINHH